MDDVSDVDLSTMYWANLAFNVFLFVVAVALAPLIGVFFHTPRVVPVVRVASVVLVVSALARSAEDPTGEAARVPSPSQ